MLGTRQGGVFVGSPFVKAEQDRAIRIQELSEVVVRGLRLRLSEERLVPPEAGRHIPDPYDRPRALHLEAVWCVRT